MSPCGLSFRRRWREAQPNGAQRPAAARVVERAAVTDTHPLLFHAARNATIGKRAAALFAACEQRRAIVYVPAAVIWEACLLSRLGRVRLSARPRDFFAALFSNPAYQPYDLTPEQVFLADETRPNEDPFDALVCAAARALELPLITRDAAIQESGLVKIVW